MAEGKFTNAILDEDNVLVGYETVTDELLHVRADGRYPWPNNEPDLAPKRYQLRKSKITGKEMFVPVVHEKDAAEENLEPSVTVNPKAIARMLLSLDSGQKLTKADKKQLEKYLSTMDAKGVTEQ